MLDALVAQKGGALLLPQPALPPKGAVLTSPGYSGAGALPLPFSPASEEEQSTLPHRCHHQLPGPLHLPGGPPGGLFPLPAAQVRRPLSPGLEQVQK